MILSKVFQALVELFPGFKSNADFVVAVLYAAVGNHDKDKAAIFNQTVKFIDGVIEGDKKITIDDTKYIVNNINPVTLDKFFKDNLPDSPDARFDIAEFIKEHGYTDDGTDKGLSNACSQILIQALEDRLKVKRGRKPKSSASLPYTNTSIESKIENLDEILASIPRPKPLAVPDEPFKDEFLYIAQLFLAYAEDANVDRIDQTNIKDFEDYYEDLKERRIEYFAAESVRRSLEEVDIESIQDQFEVLKHETYDGVKDEYKRRHVNGYEKMLAVMNQAAASQIEGYLLCKTPYWISTAIKKGVCHFLVKEGKLKWVKEKEIEK